MRTTRLWPHLSQRLSHRLSHRLLLGQLRDPAVTTDNLKRAMEVALPGY